MPATFDLCVRSRARASGEISPFLSLALSVGAPVDIFCPVHCSLSSFSFSTSLGDFVSQFEEIFAFEDAIEEWMTSIGDKCPIGTQLTEQPVAHSPCRSPSSASPVSVIDDKLGGVIRQTIICHRQLVSILQVSRPDSGWV